MFRGVSLGWLSLLIIDCAPINAADLLGCVPGPGRAFAGRLPPRALRFDYGIGGGGRDEESVTAWSFG